jgi:uncharacterized protein (DUF427 family)
VPRGDGVTTARTFASDKWIRAFRGEEVVVDSKRSLLVWKDGEVVPRLAFPEEDVQLDVSGFERVADAVLVPWDAADRWVEEEEEMVGHARDPFKRVDVRRSSRHVRVERDGQLLAETTQPILLFETGLPTRYYMPLEDVKAPVEPSDRHTQCAYKGTASYFTVGGHRDIAWYYPEPEPGMEPIKGWVAFFNERTDISVDGEAAGRPKTQWSE